MIPEILQALPFLLLVALAEMLISYFGTSPVLHTDVIAGSHVFLQIWSIQKCIIVARNV